MKPIKFVCFHLHLTIFKCFDMKIHPLKLTKLLVLKRFSKKFLARPKKKTFRNVLFKFKKYSIPPPLVRRRTSESDIDRSNSPSCNNPSPYPIENYLNQALLVDHFFQTLQLTSRMFYLLRPWVQCTATRPSTSTLDWETSPLIVFIFVQL